MKVVIAIDSFKGSLSSLEAGKAAERGILAVYPDAQTKVLPVADGGEGTVEALISGLGGEPVTLTVTGPLGEPVQAGYGIVPARRLAVMEMAQSSGLTLVPEEKRNPLNTTTYGLGEMICDAAARGCREFIIGIGGSATNDGGIGMLRALGVRFYDAAGKEVGIYGRDVENIAAVNLSGMPAVLSECVFHVACDVNNPLCGPRGASAVFGPQKGATPQIVAQLDTALSGFARCTAEALGADYSLLPGAGAAGGLGFALRSYLGAQLRPGIEIVLDAVELARYAQGADVVVTGEGRMDFQTAMGKAPCGIAAIGKRCGALVVGLCGCAGEDAEACNAQGIDAFFPILRAPQSLESAMDPEHAKENMEKTARQVFSLFAALK